MDRLARITRGFGLDEPAVAELTGAFAAMSEPWGEAAATDLPPSDVSSDGSPVEFAVDLDERHPAVQFAVEPLPIDGTRDGASAAARRMMSMLVKRYGADDTRWRAVADLYLPERPARDHVAMYGAEIGRGRPLGFKVWFYPGVAGEEATGELLRRGLDRLAMPAAWDAVRAHARRGLDTDLPMLISLDLTADRSARVKVYFRHYDIGADALADLMGHQPGFVPKKIGELCRRVVGGDDLAEQPPVSCLTFTADEPGRVRAATLYLPLWRYASDDEVVRVRVGRLLRDQGRSPAAYHHGLEQVAGRPLDGGRGIHNYLSWQPGRHGPRFKVYWSPELRHINPPVRYRHEGPPTSVRRRVRP
jgi:hypothetical protein